MQKIFTFVLFFLSALIASADVTPSCLLKCVNNADPSDYKLICGKEAGTTLVCVEKECVTDFYEDAVKVFLAVCKDEGITVDVKKATATIPSDLPEKTNSSDSGDDDDDSEPLNNDDSAEDEKDGDESSATKVSAGLIGFSALVMAVLAL